MERVKKMVAGQLVEVEVLPAQKVVNGWDEVTAQQCDKQGQRRFMPKVRSARFHQELRKARGVRGKSPHGPAVTNQWGYAPTPEK